MKRKIKHTPIKRWGYYKSVECKCLARIVVATYTYVTFVSKSLHIINLKLIQMLMQINFE